MERTLIILIWIWLAGSSTNICNSQSLYKYEINIDHIEIPKKDLLIDYGTLRVKKFNRTTYTLDGYLDLLKPFSDDLWANVDIFAESGNDYKKLLDKRINNLCTFFKDDKMVIAKIIHLTSLAPAIAKCPIPAGRIHWYNTHMPTERLPMESILEKGKFRLQIYSGEVLMSNISLYFVSTRQVSIF